MRKIRFIEIGVAGPAPDPALGEERERPAGSFVGQIFPERSRRWTFRALAGASFAFGAQSGSICYKDIQEAELGMFRESIHKGAS